MSEAATDILLRIKVEVTGLSAIQQLNAANAKVQMTQDRLAASAARAQTAQERLATAQQRTAAAGLQAQAAAARLATAQSRADKAATDLQAAEQRLIATQNKAGASAAQLAAAELRVQQASARLAAAQANVANAESRAAGAASRAQAAAVGLAAAESRAAQAATNAATAEVRLSTAQSNAATAMSRAEAAALRLQRTKTNLDNANKKVGKSVGYLVSKFTDFSKRLNDTERAMDAVFRAGVHLQSMGRDLLGTLKKLTGFISGATDAWGDYEYWLMRAAGAAEIFDTQGDMYGILSDKIMEAARSLGFFDPKQVAEGFYYWQSTAGEIPKTANDIATAMKNVEAGMQTAAMTGADFEQVMKGAYSISRQFRLPMKEIPNILADLYMITKNTSLEYSDLIQSFKYTGPIAKMLGGSYKDVAKWLGIIGDLGQRGSMSGRGLGMMFTQLVRPTDKAKNAYNKLFKAQLGVKNGYQKLVFPKGKFVGFEKWVSTLAKSMHGLTQQQKLQYLTTITGTQNSARIVLPLVDAQSRAIKKGSDIFKESKYSLAGSAKVFQKSWETLSMSWKGVTGRLKNTVMPMFLHLGKSVAKMLTPLLDDLTQTLWDMKPAFEDVTKSIVDSFQPAVDDIGKLLKKALEWFKANPKIVKQIATWGVLAVVIGGVVGAVMLAVGTLIFFLNTMVLIVVGMLPMLAVIGAVIAAFVLLGTKIYQNVGGIRDAIGVLINSIVSAFNRLLGGTDGVGKGLGGLWEAINKVIDDGLKVLAGWILAVADAIDKMTPEDVQTLKGIAGALLAIAVTWKSLNILNDSFKALNESLRGFKMVASGLGAVAQTIAGIPGMISSLPGILTGIGAGIRGIGAALAANPIGLAIMAIVAAITAFVVAYETNFMGFRDFVDGIVQWFVTNVGPVIAGIFQWLQEVIPPILQGLADFFNNVLMPAVSGFIDWLVATFTPVIEQVSATLAAMGEFFGALGDKVTEVVNAIMEWLNSLGLNVDTNFSGIQEIIMAVLGFIGEFIGNWLEALFAVWSALWDGISTAVKIVVETIAKVIEGAFQIIEGIFEIFTAALNGDWDAFWNGIKDIVDGIFKIISGLVDGFVKGIGNLIDTGLKIVDGIFKAFFGDGPDSIYSHVKGFIDTITKFGGDILGGLAKGVGDAVSGTITAVTGFVGDIIDGVKDFLGIKSPSTVFAKIGDNIVAGLWKGINDAKDWIIGKVMGFIKAVIPQPVLDALGIKSPSRVMAAIGENVVKGLAVGIERTDDAQRAMEAQAQSLMTAMGGISAAATTVGGSFNSTLSSDATKTINLNVDVTSGDGSVSSLDMTTLADLITGSDMVRALEMMATVD